MYTKDMTIYFSGIGGVGLGPLAEIAHDAGYDVAGSDKEASPMTRQLSDQGIAVFIGQENGEIARFHEERHIDWFVYSAAVAEGHPELEFAREHGIRVSKRDELLAHIIKERNLKLVAVSGTHGKTTTTGLLVWVFKRLGIPVSYSVGTTLSFGPSGAFDGSSEYFIYEADEYDRNMLHFEPFLTLIPSLDYDHPDTYENPHVYKDAFVKFMEQSHLTLLWEKDLRYLEHPDIAASYEAYDEHMDLSRFTLPGDHVRHNAFLVQKTLEKIMPNTETRSVAEAINAFPGSGRRFEKLAENLYSDYGHHPSEIAATLQLARELSDHVVLVYQPHQNIRQHELKDHYTDCMRLAEKIYWVPTYLTREDPALPVLMPEQLFAQLTNKEAVQAASLDDELWQTIQHARSEAKLVLTMGAGTIDAWVRQKLAETK